ncbi:MAG: hypothetical protein HQL87_07655 [Magnetococcales bacterium]|nr:hypothetical protein [Magnetococcales bacterium]
MEDELQMDDVWEAAVGSTTPEEALWLSVLRQAVYDLDGTSDERVDAMSWLRSDEKAAGSFDFICGLFDMSTVWIRRRILLRDREKRQGRKAVCKEGAPPAPRQWKRRGWVQPSAELECAWWMQPGAGKVPPSMAAG